MTENTKVGPKLQAIMDQHPEQLFLQPNGFDDAIIGIEPVPEDEVEAPDKKYRLKYSVKRVLEILMDEDDEPDPDEAYTNAREHFDFNIGGAYVGTQTPVWVEDEDEEL